MPTFQIWCTVHPQNGEDAHTFSVGVEGDSSKAALEEVQRRMTSVACEGVAVFGDHQIYAEIWAENEPSARQRTLYTF